MMKVQLLAVVFILITGCFSDAPVEMAATETLYTLADQMALAIQEYHQEVANFDDSRESAMIAAFVTRLRNNSSDDSAIENHVTDFKSALQKIRTDRQTEWSRRQAAMDNVSVLKEVAGGLQQLAIESLTLNDEMQRYLNGWIELRRRTNALGTGELP